MRTLLCLLFVSKLAAHDLDAEYVREGRAVIVTAAYAGTEAAAFSLITITGPDKKEFQNGRTDAKGRFAFVPEAAGKWTVVVDDELGHRKEVAIEVGAITEGPAGGAQPVWQKALTGGSLLFGLTGIWLWWRVREKL